MTGWGEPSDARRWTDDRVVHLCGSDLRATAKRSAAASSSDTLQLYWLSPQAALLVHQNVLARALLCGRVHRNVHSRR